MNPSRVLAAVLALLLSLTVLPTNAFAAPPEIKVEVTITAPDAVPAQVALNGAVERHVTKSPVGTSQTSTFALPAGSYQVESPAAIWQGKRYVATESASAFVAAKDGDALTVDYELAPGMQDFFVTGLEANLVKLEWTAPAELAVDIRRASGEVAPATDGDGAAVAVTGESAIDDQVQAGQLYSYAAFVAGEQVFTVVVGTPAANEASEAFVRDYGSVFLAESAPVGFEADGLRVSWPQELPLPLLGAVVVLPISDELPGGFVGSVVDVALDGSAVLLNQAGFADAFAFVDIKTPDIAVAAGVVPQPPDPEVTPAPRPPDEPSRDPGDRTPADAKVRPTKLPETGSNDISSSCKVADGHDVVGSFKAEFKPFFEPVGHFNVTGDRYQKILFTDVATAMRIDVQAAVKVGVMVSAEAKAELKCGPKLDKKVWTWAPGGVPVALVFEPTAELVFFGGLSVENIELSSTVGGAGEAVIGLGVFEVTPKKVVGFEPKPPTSMSVVGGVEIKVGGELTFGPGAGISQAGVVAGISGELNVVDASFKGKIPLNPAHSACVTTTAQASAALKLSAKAWFGAFSAEASAPLVEGALAVPGSPWTLPKGCDVGPVHEDVLGPGVTKNSDSITGGSTQWGRLDGFVPGQTTWVLSTGNIADAVGSPSTFASTVLNQPGNALLSAMSGHETYDAASYTVTLVPTGSKLHVDYVFASEEYPEYVDSRFNDVMAVFVDGKNCATVPGTDLPVAVNNVNQWRNSEYYVDNSTAAAGYNTTMDGLTKPLRCSVPVQPGKPVTVVIAVADASDSVYDSAVALLDKGIWSE